MPQNAPKWPYGMEYEVCARTVCASGEQSATVSLLGQCRSKSAQKLSVIGQQ